MATHAGAELDLMITNNGKMVGIEFKYTGSPRITSSIKIAINNLKLSNVMTIYPGDMKFKIADNIEAIGPKNFQVISCI